MTLDSCFLVLVSPLHSRLLRMGRPSRVAALMPQAVIAIIKGGLGNQLFIYAAARAFALRTGRELYIDARRGYTHDGYGRSYRLDRFPIAAKAMPESWRVAPTLKHFRHRAVRAWNKLLPRDWRTYLAQRWDLPPGQLTDLRPRRGRVTLSGYWANEAFFADQAETIRPELAPPAPSDARNLDLGERLSAEPTVFLHARRIRYPTLLEPDYYRQALAHVRKHVANPRFAVFSDDPAWVRKEIDFEGSPVEWIEHNADDEMADLWLMSRCRHAITANSSFSWWGAWLGGPPSDRIIVTPDHPDWIIRPAAGWHRIPFDFQPS